MKNKQTKIICTISNKHCEPEFISELAEAGMNLARLNTAHMQPEDAQCVVDNIRSISQQIGILIDTKGPEVRIAELPDPLDRQAGDEVRVASDHLPENGFRVNYLEFVNEVPVGERILIDDGEVELEVTAKTADELLCRVCNDGTIKNAKSINVPGVGLELPALTERDVSFIQWAVEAEVDFIAHSFVRNRDDVMAVQSILNMHKSPIKIIAKIENREGVRNLESILDAAHGVMIARGDLGIEIPAEEVPIIQKKMIRACISRRKPVITATQMLHSMIDNPRATRAEVSDVANAVYDGTDALMLSGETAYGKYPVESVQTMVRIAKSVEAQKSMGQGDHSPEQIEPKADKPHFHLAKSAVFMANALQAKAIITSTKSGDTAQICAAHRGQSPIYAFSASARTVRELSLTYGVRAEQIQVPDTTDALVKTALERLLAQDCFKMDDLIVFVGGGHIYSAHTNFLQVDTPSTLLKENDLQ